MENLNEMIKFINLSQLIGIITIIITAILAYATWKSAKATEKSAKATERLIKMQYIPYVIVYTKISSCSAQLISIIIENIGTAPAFDIQFDIPEYFPWNAHGLENKNAPMPQNLNSGPLRYGMKNLAPKEKWQSVWGQYGGLLAGLEDKPVKINITYSDYKNNKICNSYRIDIHDFDSSIYTIGNENDISNSIKGINETLKKINNKIKICK